MFGAVREAMMTTSAAPPANAEHHVGTVVALKSRGQRAALGFCRFVDTHLYRFEPRRSADFPALEDVKPLGDLLLILLALERPSLPPAQRIFSDWAKHASARLWDFVESYAESIPWKAMRTVVAGRPHAAIPLMVVPLIETLTCKESAFHNEVRQTLAEALHGTRGVSPDLSFAADVAGMADCTETACQWLRDEIAILRPDAPPTSSALYAITHAIFYAAKMGHRPLPLPEADRSSLASRLVRFAEDRLAMGDYDLGSELLLSARWACAEEPAEISSACETLAAVAERHGSIPPHPKVLRSSLDLFENRYHPTLAALAALAEYSRADEILKGETV
jgi:hypothetical protein